MEIAISIIGSAAMFGFIEFLIRRRDEKKGVLASIKDDIHKIQDEIKQMKGEREEANATNARRRILNASDEILHYDKKHSEEWFTQLLSEVSFYEAYCDSHPAYKNAKAMLAIERIKEVYARCLEQGDFL